MSVQEAQRIGVKFEDGRRIRARTANGDVVAYVVKLHNVRIQDVVVYDVEATVSQGGMPYVLLGNSFLTRFQFKRENEQLTLTKRF
jgi:aspartyl protease family protein